MALLNSYLKIQHCHLVKHNFDSIYELANTFLLKHLFVECLEQLEKAIHLSDLNPDCHVDASYAKTDYKLYLQNSNYQKLLIKAANKLEESNYAECFFYYSQAEIYYKTNQLNTSGLRHISLVEKVEFSTDSVFILKAFEYFMEKSLLMEALLCLKTLEKINYPLLASANKQIQLGKTMALKDHLLDYSLNPNIKTLQYTDNHVWLTYFRKSYVKTWRSMR
jgi:hypothetical protein